MILFLNLGRWREEVRVGWWRGGGGGLGGGGRRWRVGWWRGEVEGWEGVMVADTSLPTLPPPPQRD